MAQKHTPGPWLKNITKRFIEMDGLAITDSKSRLICTVSHNLAEIGLDEYVANANVVYAAPDLLEALEELRTVYLFNQSKTQAKNNHINETLLKVDAAIKKAKNE